MGLSEYITKGLQINQAIWIFLVEAQTFYRILWSLSLRDEDCKVIKNMQSTQLSDIWTFYVKSGGKCLKRINLEVALEQESICEVPYHATSTMYVKGQEKRLSYMSIKLKKQ